MPTLKPSTVEEIMAMIDITVVFEMNKGGASEREAGERGIAFLEQVQAGVRERLETLRCRLARHTVPPA